MQCAQISPNSINRTEFNNTAEIENDYSLTSSYSNEMTCVWHRTSPDSIGFIVYAFLVPVLAFFGFCANFINAMVFMRPKMSPSAFTYLAALSWLDCASCVLIMLTSFSRSICYDSTVWIIYDFHWQMPLFGFTTGAANLVLACLSVDRLVYLRCWSMNGVPGFCRRRVARHMVGVVLTISFILNLPYFFVFVVNPDGSLQVTPYYFSAHYKFHNWFTFLLLAVIPAIFLLVGNAAIMIAFRRWAKQSKKCDAQCQHRNQETTNHRLHHQMKLTITIIIVVTLYLFGELPAHLTSRKSAVNLMFGGDMSKVDFEVMARVEMICITLNALQLSMNIIVYSIINPSFIPEFFVCLRKVSDLVYKWLGFNYIARKWKIYRKSTAERKQNKSIPKKDNEKSNDQNDGKAYENAALEVENHLPPIHLTLGV